MEDAFGPDLDANSFENGHRCDDPRKVALAFYICRSGRIGLLSKRKGRLNVIAVYDWLFHRHIVAWVESLWHFVERSQEAVKCHTSFVPTLSVASATRGRDGAVPHGSHFVDNCTTISLSTRLRFPCIMKLGTY
jgi:hypothetical protein